MGSNSPGPHRGLMAALAFAGCGVCAYLSLYECRVTRSVWDPVFGGRSSEAVLDSHVSRRLPVPDAVLGCAAYAAEAALVLAAGRKRCGRRAWARVLLPALVNGLALTAVVQVLVQALVVRAFCALCLAVAGISFCNAWLGRRETGLALAQARRSLSKAV